jgi:hypothetical protein
MANQPISQFSESICKKIPACYRISTGPNARWILKSPVRLTSLEKTEVLAVYENWCKSGRI